MKITVFTPTYNRAYIIENLYRSLQRQTCTDFEWLVVDDGSTDNTSELFTVWQQENNPFPIRYYRQENGGKHRAINRGVTLATGSLFYIVDSDDWLPADSILRTLHWINTLPAAHVHQFCGICGLKANSNENAVGTTFPGKWLDCTCLQRDSYGISGDKAEVFFTEILRKYPFPEFDGENFITEAVVWDRVAADGYLFRFFNEIIYLCEYREDGLTNQGLDLYLRNPQGYALYLRQSRGLKKFKPSVQNYHDVEFALHWKEELGISKVAKLLSLFPLALWAKVSFYQVKHTLHKAKSMLVNVEKQ